MEATHTHHDTLVARLDLTHFISNFYTYFAREKSFIFNGDRIFYTKILKELDSAVIPYPPSLESLDESIILLQKQATLQLEYIFSFMKLVRYFILLKKHITESTPNTKIWLDKIIIPETICEIESVFDEQGNIKDGIYNDIDTLRLRIKNTKQSIDAQINQILHMNNLSPYLVDGNIHYINQNECLLLKAGYNKVINGVVLERSHNGFFYLVPNSIIKLKEKQNSLNEKLQENLYVLCKSFCHILRKQLAFLTFLNHAFDTFDHIHARLHFAKANNLTFVYDMSKQNDIVLHEFSHPTLQNPKPINISFNGKTLMITGVNAGGKTILLKSILTACFLTKYLIPFKINAHYSKIPHFKHIVAIISDPQNSKNDISTFAGRMLEFREILNVTNILVGIDEIELGTDADEAASLYKILLEYMMEKKAKIVLTTHHKRLAAIMAHNIDVQLCAAMYDMQAQKPLFNFLDGSIGKSYAFESAQRYGIPYSLIKQAKDTYGVDKERLNELIERSSKLEITLKNKIMEADELINKYQAKIISLQEQEKEQKEAFVVFKNNLESTYNQAIQTLKSALKAQESKEMHTAFNKAHKTIKNIQLPKPSAQKAYKFKIGDRVKYKNAKGCITHIKGKICIIELDSGFKLKEKLENLEPSNVPIKANQINIAFEQSKNMGVSLDLHGIRGDEALEKLDEFLSASLLAGYDEVFVYHGIGSGKLSGLICEYLKKHPKIVSFEDAPAQMGGFGAKVIKL